MAEFKLPGGRLVETHEPTFGEEVHVVSVGSANIEELVYAKCAVIVPGLTREEVASLNREDGRALLTEVGRIWDERPEEKAVPFGRQSNGASVAPRSKTRKRATASINTNSAGA